MKNKTKIYFIENSFDYNANDFDSPNIGGSEKTLINISNALSKNENFIIKVFNNTSNPMQINNVIWSNINQKDNNDRPDYVVAMSDANLFKKVHGYNNFLWSHSVQSIEKFVRKKQLLPFIKYKPVLILEGEYHYKTRNFLTSFFGKKILKIAPDYDFINSKIYENHIPPPNAIFTTKSDRNLEQLLKAWKLIKEKNNYCKLFINPPFKLSKEHVEDNVFLRTKGNKQDLINDLINSKLFISPGHKTEVFCLAAAEASELCVPIVTLGLGSLYERVIHGETGYIAKNTNEFIDYSKTILENNDIYCKLKKNLMKKRNSRNYESVKNDFLKILNIND
tara:strand:+ start:997 stop:2004 length:1008 start_codon:yes stop_codon:yes gene_type:complete